MAFMAALPYLAAGGLGAMLAHGHLKDQIFGTKPQIKKFDLLGGRQKHFLENIFSQLKHQNIDVQKRPLFRQGESYLHNLLKQTPQSTESLYNTYSAPMLRQFREQTVPGIAEQFAGVGGLSSSGFQQSLGQASDSLRERLMALSAGLGQQQEQNLYGRQMQGLGLGLNYEQLPINQMYRYGALGLGTPQFGYTGMPGQSGLLGGMAGGAGQGLGAAMMMKALA